MSRTKSALQIVTHRNADITLVFIANRAGKMLQGGKRLQWSRMGAGRPSKGCLGWLFEPLCRTGVLGGIYGPTGGICGYIWMARGIYGYIWTMAAATFPGMGAYAMRRHR